MPKATLLAAGIAAISTVACAPRLDVPTMGMPGPMMSNRPIPAPTQALSPTTSILALKLLGFNQAEQRTYFEALVEVPGSSPYYPGPTGLQASAFRAYLDPTGQTNYGAPRQMPPPGHVYPDNALAGGPIGDPIGGGVHGGILGGLALAPETTVQDTGAITVDLASQTGPSLYTLVLGVPGDPQNLMAYSLVVTVNDPSQGKPLGQAEDLNSPPMPITAWSTPTPAMGGLGGGISSGPIATPTPWPQFSPPAPASPSPWPMPTPRPTVAAPFPTSATA